jgi:hypothetical protein
MYVTWSLSRSSLDSLRPAQCPEARPADGPSYSTYVYTSILFATMVTRPHGQGSRCRTAFPPRMNQDTSVNSVSYRGSCRQLLYPAPGAPGPPATAVQSAVNSSPSSTLRGAPLSALLPQISTTWLCFLRSTGVSKWRFSGDARTMGVTWRTVLAMRQLGMF